MPTRPCRRILDQGIGLDWTIARPGILNDNKMSPPEIQGAGRPRKLAAGLISRADVAHFLVHAAEDGTYIHKTPALQR